MTHVASVRKNRNHEIRIELDVYEQYPFVRIRTGPRGDAPDPKAKVKVAERGLTVGVEKLDELIRALQLARQKAGEQGMLS